MFVVKRAYEPAESADGYRVLVDRLWPRGISKERAALDAWDKEIAPSTELRKWFGHDPKKWDGFRKRYEHELDEQDELIGELCELGKGRHKVTLVYGARDTEHNEAVVLQEYLDAHCKR